MLGGVAPDNAGLHVPVAILTESGEPVLAQADRHPAADRPRCDPHRIRGANAGRPPGTGSPTCAESCDPHRLRGAGAGGQHLSGHVTAPPQGCDPHRLRGAGAGWMRFMCPALLPRCCDPHRRRRAGAGCRARSAPAPGCCPLRSAPTPGSLCWLTQPNRCQPPDTSRLRSAPTPGSRCWLPRLPGDSDNGRNSCDPHRLRGAGAGARSRSGNRSRSCTRCDPHRLRGAGAGLTAGSISSATKERLRSSPTPGSRCWSALPLDASPGRLGVAILTDSGEPVLVACIAAAVVSSC